MRRQPIIRFTALSALGAITLAPRGVDAQNSLASSPSSAPHASCLDAIPASAMSRVLAYIWAESEDSSATARNAGGLIAESAGDRLRAMLGDSGSTVPRADGRLSWRQIDGSVRVVLHRTSGIAVASPADSLADDTTAGAAAGNRTGIRMVAEATRQLSSEPAMDFWPPGVRGDSLAFRLSLVTPDVRHDGTVKPLSVAPAVPVFTLEQPWIDDVRVVTAVMPHYPDGPHRANVIGSVMLAFVVDSSGRPDSTTLHDMWPPGRPRPTGSAADDYRAFYASAREASLLTTFTPRIIGGCRVGQLVQQPFQFLLTQ